MSFQLYDGKDKGLVRTCNDWSFLLSIDTMFYKNMLLRILFSQPRYHIFFTSQRNQPKHKQTTVRASVFLANNRTRRCSLCCVTLEKRAQSDKWALTNWKGKRTKRLKGTQSWDNSINPQTFLYLQSFLIFLHSLRNKNRVPILSLRVYLRDYLC